MPDVTWKDIDEMETLYGGIARRARAEQRRRIVPGADGIRFLALGGVVGSHRPSPWTELGGPWPTPA
jgi:hypothetical protein